MVSDKKQDFESKEEKVAAVVTVVIVLGIGLLLAIIYGFYYFSSYKMKQIEKRQSGLYYIRQ